MPLKSGKGIGYVDYELDIPESGTYKIYARVYFLDGCSNSFDVQINNKSHILTDEQFKLWHVLSGLKTVSLEKGKVSIRLNNTEDGISIDYLELRKLK